MAGRVVDVIGRVGRMPLAIPAQLRRLDCLAVGPDSGLPVDGLGKNWGRDEGDKRSRCDEDFHVQLPLFVDHP